MSKEKEFKLSQSERDALMEQVYGGYVRSPEIRTWGRGSEWNPRHNNAGKIDYAAYGGKASNYHDERAVSSIEYWKKKGKDHPFEGKDNYYGNAYRNRDTWGKVAKHLGIDKIDDEGDLRQMYDFVKGYSQKEEPQEDTVQEPSEPPVFTPSDAHQEAKAEYESIRDNPVPRMSDQPGLAGSSGSSDPMMDAIRHGDDLNDWYQEDTKRRVAEAKLGAYEMGERTRFYANQFVGKIPELGDVGKLYESYADKLKDMG